MGFGLLSCAVIGSPNSGKRLNKWSSSICKIHRCFHCESPCKSEPPFRLFAFPTELKNKEARTRWTKAINRQNEKAKLWLPKKSSRVCSEHFVSGKPTEDNPDPELNLGYKTPLKPKRELPSMRSDAPTKRPKGCKDNREIFNQRSTCSSTVTEDTFIPANSPGFPESLQVFHQISRSPS